MFSEMCHIYFPTSFICVVRLSKQSTHYYAYNNSTQHARLSKQYLFVPPGFSLLSADAGPTWCLWKGSPAVPDREFQAQEGLHIVGVSMRDGKPMGIIEAPMEAIARCKKNVSGASGSIDVSEVVTSTTAPLII